MTQATASDRKPRQRAGDEPHFVQVGEQRHARGEPGQCPGLRERQVQEDPGADTGDRARERV
jgi:hypothetical protein